MPNSLQAAVFGGPHRFRQKWLCQPQISSCRHPRFNTPLYTPVEPAYLCLIPNPRPFDVGKLPCGQQARQGQYQKWINWWCLCSTRTTSNIFSGGEPIAGPHLPKSAGSCVGARVCYSILPFSGRSISWISTMASQSSVRHPIVQPCGGNMERFLGDRPRFSSPNQTPQISGGVFSRRFPACPLIQPASDVYAINGYN